MNIRNKPIPHAGDDGPGPWAEREASRAPRWTVRGVHARNQRAHPRKGDADGPLLWLVLQQNARGTPARPAPELVVHRPGVSPPPPAKLPSKRWRDLILRVWHVDPLRCPVCQNPMRVMAVIDDPRVVEKILRHLGAWHDPPACQVTATQPQDGLGTPHLRTVRGCRSDARLRKRADRLSRSQSRCSFETDKLCPDATVSIW